MRLKRKLQKAKTKAEKRRTFGYAAFAHMAEKHPQTQSAGVSILLGCHSVSSRVTASLRSSYSRELTKMESMIPFSSRMKV